MKCCLQVSRVSPLAGAASVAQVRTWAKDPDGRVRVGTSHLRPKHPFSAYRQYDPRTPSAGGLAPGHCESVPAVLGLTYHRLHDLCRWLRGLLMSGEHWHPVLFSALSSDTPTLTSPLSFPQGDSGGPLVCQKGNVWVLIGIVSWGTSNCNVRAPAMYTRVSKFSTWINQVTAYN